MISRVLRFVPALVLALLPAAIAVAETPSGLPLPRFVTTRSTPIVIQNLPELVRRLETLERRVAELSRRDQEDSSS